MEKEDLESVPMQEIHKEKAKDDFCEQKSKESFFSEFRNSDVIQLQIKRSVCNSGAYMTLGWTKGQIGPAFPDIMMISGADLKHGSAFMTSLYTGHLLGSVLGGLVHSKINKNLLFGISLVLSSLIVAAIPWCYLYELMIAAHTFFGLCGGILAVAIGTESVDIWGPTSRGHSYLMVSSAVYSISSVLAPLVTAPFLLEQTNYNQNDTSWNSTSVHSSIYTLLNSTNQSGLPGMDWPNNKPTAINRSMSKLYIAYTISAVLSMLTAMSFFILFCQQTPIKKERSQKGESHFIGERSLLLKRLQLLNISVFSVMQNAIDFTFIGYLTVFCIDYLGWTKASGAMVTSIAFFTRLLGTLSGIFLVRYVQPLHILLISTIVSTAGFLGFTISAHLYFDAGIWISVCAIGIPYGLMWPNMLSWFNENLIPLRGAVSGFLHFTVFLGALLAPQLFGYLMNKISLLWYCYLCCILSLVIVVNAILMFLYTDKKR